MADSGRTRGAVPAGNSTPAHTVEPAIGQDHLAAAAAVRHSVLRLGRRLRAARPAGSVSLSKLNVLGDLQPVGALTAGELAARERAQPQSLTRVLAELEQEGLIVREQDPADRRRVIVRITGAGTAALVRDMRGRDAWLAEAMASALTPVERELLRLAARLLDRLADY